MREFSALPDGLRAMTGWLRSHGVTAAAMEGTGVYWKAPFEALEDAGIHADLLNAQHVKQIRGKKTDASDSLWLARICQFGLALPSYVPPRRFRQLRQRFGAAGGAIPWTPPTRMGGDRWVRPLPAIQLTTLSQHQHVVIGMRDARRVGEHLPHAMTEGVDRRAEGVI